jgi:hypothetical protein
MHNMPGAADQPPHRVAADRVVLRRVRATDADAVAAAVGTSLDHHCDQANAASAAIARKLGYRLDRVERCQPGAPGESGRLMVWAMVP